MTNELVIFGRTPVLKELLPQWSWPPRYPMGADRQGLSGHGTTLSIQGRASVIACEIRKVRG